MAHASRTVHLTDDQKEFDARLYITPPAVVRAVLPHLHAWISGVPDQITIVEPCMGTGAIAETLIECGASRDKIIGYEIVPELAQYARDNGLRCVERDCCQPITETQVHGTCDLLIMNPPFRRSVQIFEAMLPLLKPGGQFLMLQRAGFISTKGRCAFHEKYPMELFVLDQRPGFTKSGKSDVWDVCWLGYTKGVASRQPWQPLKWKHLVKKDEDKALLARHHTLSWSAPEAEEPAAEAAG